MRLVVQVPCLNEAETLPSVLASIPRSIPGINEIVIVVIDDGSTDGTADVARAHGVSHVVRHAGTQGLGRSFHDGVQYALSLGADVLVNTDGDNQYPSDRIADLVAPIVNGEADIVIADRQTQLIAHFSPSKKLLQRAGSAIVNRAAGTHVPDAASGFRAYSQNSLVRLNTVTRFSYCMETIIQAGNKRLTLASVPIITNPKTRESRLFTSHRQHVYKSAAAITRAFIMYKPYLVFGWLAALLSVVGFVPFARYALLTAQGQGGGHLQSLLVGAVLLIVAFLTLMLGVLSDLIRTNRILIEQQLEQGKMQSIGSRLARTDLSEPTAGRLRPAR